MKTILFKYEAPVSELLGFKAAGLVCSSGESYDERTELDIMEDGVI